MPKLRSLVLMLAFCAFTSAASADDFWMAPLPDQTLQSIEYEVREARHQQDWDRILGRYRH
jgi:hypothetical protein